jgi:hypothetical protein
MASPGARPAWRHGLTRVSACLPAARPSVRPDCRSGARRIPQAAQAQGLLHASRPSARRRAN